MQEKLKKVKIYTDGACSGNPGPGGWAAVLLYGSHTKEISGFNKLTTNNRMELLAVIEGLKALKTSVDVTVYTDSAYVHNAFTEKWLDNWQKNDWKNAGRKAVQNKDLWLELLRLSSLHRVSWVKVKGHSNNELNNRCDFLATNEIAKNTPETISDDAGVTDAKTVKDDDGDSE